MSSTPPALPAGPTGRPVGIAARVAAAGHHLVEVGGEATSAELGHAAGCTNTKMRGELLQRLAADELITRPTGRARLTPAGWARFAGQVLDVGAGEVVDRALAGWPAAHRAFLELLLSAVVARHHLPEVPDEHLGFMAIGETGTGKSAMAGLVVHLFGLSPQLTRLHLPAQAVGAVLGRRERVEGGGYRLEASPVTRQPFLFLDEIDKADPDVRKAAWSYFQGERALLIDGQVHELAPAPMLAANPPRSADRLAIARTEYRRRSAVLDTGYLRGRAGDLQRMLRGYYASAAANRLDLSRLVPPATAMTAAGLAVLDAAQTLLTDAGLEEYPGTRALAQVALGRAALMGTRDLTLAAYATVVSYLLATETVEGQVQPDWGADAASVRRAFDSDAADRLLAAIKAGRAERARHRRAREGRALQGRMAVAVAHGEVVEVRDRLAEQIAQTRAAIDGQQLRGAGRDVLAAAKGLRGRLAEVRADVLTANDLDKLRALALAAADPLRRADQLRAAVDEHRRRVDDERADQTRVRRQTAADARAFEAQRKAQVVADRKRLQADLRDCRRTLVPLEKAYTRRTTPAGENPLEVLRGLQLAGRPLLAYVPPATPSSSRRDRFVGTVLQVVSPGTAGRWRILWPLEGPPVTFAGGPDSCPALSRWGPSTQAVLAAPMLTLHAIEDGLLQQLDLPTRARRARPTVDVTALRAHVTNRPALAQRSTLPRGPSGR